MEDPGAASDEALALAREMGLSFTAADVLHRAGFAAGEPLERWLEPRLAHLTPPDAMAGLGAATERLARAARSRERVCVFGDYDCDGITATALVTEVVRALGGEVAPLSASRFAGGYGLSAPAAARVRETGATLLVTCDCGSSDHARLADLGRAGVDAIVVDHHLVPAEPLPALAFLNPHQPGCGHGYKGLASVGIGLMLATALRKHLGVTLDVKRWLDLVAVGTVADVAPLDGDNRALVRAGLRVLDRGERVGLRALAIQGAGGRRIAPTAEAVSYQVAPRLNAPGRLGDPKLALDLCLERDPARAWQMAEEVQRLSDRRRAIQREMMGEALREIEERGFAADAGMALARQGWHPGVVGIVAGRLADRLGRPAIVIALDGARGRGSARAPAGFRVYDALRACARELVGFGGHQAAAGLEIEAARVERFRDAWREACARQAAAAVPAGVRPEARLDERDDPAQVAGDLERFEPCGERNPAPRLLVHSAVIAAVRRHDEHLRLELLLRGARRVGAFAPDLGPRAAELAPGASVSVVGRLRRDTYRGAGALDLLVEAIAPS
jgi:single-stranded-DNA-specific exonuclease